MMGFLKRILGGGVDEGAKRAADSVWLDHRARVRGIAREAGMLASEGRSVLVVALALGALDELAAAVVALQPKRCVDLFERDALRRHLERPGAVAVVLPGALPTDAALAGNVPLDLLVCGRNDRRRADEAIARVAGILSPDARVTFHLALDDPLIARFGAEITPILERLGLTADEPIQHAMVTRAIENAQRKAAGG
jgi:preprotein translocase subunit SecA